MNGVSKKVLIMIVTTLIAAIILGYMIWNIWDELLLSLDYLVSPYILLSILICVGVFLLRGLRYQYILKKADTYVSLVFSTAMFLFSQLINVILPARLGDISRVLILHHEKETNYTTGFSSILIERFFDVIALTLLGLCTLPFLISIIPVWMLEVICIVVIGCILTICILFCSKKFQSNKKILRIFLSILDQIRSQSLSPSNFIVLTGSSVFIWLIECVLCFVVSIIFSVSIPFLLVVLAVIIANLSKIIPVTPGSLGVYEAVLAVTLTLGGVPVTIAALIAIIDHLLINLVPVVGGIFSMYYFGDWTRTLVKKLFRDGNSTQKNREA